MFKKNLPALFILFSSMFVFVSAAHAQTAAESHLFQVMLPANAQRVAAESVPAEITQTFDKIVAAGNGKFRQGETEFLVWSGAGFKKANAEGIVSRLSSVIKTAGWKYTVEGEENGVTLFSAVKENPRRAVVGFYGATDEVLIVGAMEILPNNANGETTQKATADDSAEQSAQVQNKPPKNTEGSGSVVGTWGDGYTSLLSGYSPTIGPKSYTPGRSHRFEYEFHPNGTYTFTGLSQNTIYSCTTTIFNDQRGTYKINGDQITLTKTKNFFRRTDSCSAANNLEINHTLGSETLTYSVNRNDRNREQICFDDGKNKPCYERAEK